MARSSYYNHEQSLSTLQFHSDTYLPPRSSRLPARFPLGWNNAPIGPAESDAPLIEMQESVLGAFGKAQYILSDVKQLHFLVFDQSAHPHGREFWDQAAWGKAQREGRDVVVGGALVEEGEGWGEGCEAGDAGEEDSVSHGYCSVGCWAARGGDAIGLGRMEENQMLRGVAVLERWPSCVQVCILS